MTRLEQLELWRGHFERAYREEDPNANLRPILDNDGVFLRYYMSCTEYMWGGWLLAMEHSASTSE